MKSLLCLILCTATAYAAPPMPKADPPAPAPSPVAPPYILPVVPTPAPAPPPVGTPIQLVPGKPFVIRINAATVLASPQGLVKMKTKAEPLTVVDADGNDTEYSGDKSVCFIWPVKGASGPCELLIVPTDGSAVGRVSLIVGTPTPPGPGPGPGPVDPLTATLQAAYTADTGADKAAALVFLRSVFQLFASLPVANVPPTVAVAASEIQTAIASPVGGLKPTQLPGVRKAVTAELTTALGSPTSTAGLDPAKYLSEMNRIATALQGVK
jgi:hypothetical protein